MYKYKAFGLNILSQIEFSELGTFENQKNEIDLTISFGEVEFEDEKKVELFDDIFYIKTKESYIISVESVARFNIRNGKEIIIDKAVTATINEIKIFIWGTCIGALFLQKSIFCLHGSGIIYNNHVSLFLGHSGMGKSTLTTFFIQNGLKYIGDDVLPILWNNETELFVSSSIPYIKLWKSNLENLNIQEDGLTQIRGGIPKFRFSNKEMFLDGKFNVKSIFILDWSNDQPLSIEKINPINALPYLRENIYRLPLISNENEKIKLFHTLSYLTKTFEIFLIKGHRNFESLNKLKQNILNV
jgi:hypothetical protein